VGSIPITRSIYNIPPVKRRELLQLCENHGVVAFLAGHTHKLVVNEYKGIQFVNGETTSRNMDNRPMGFRWWDVSAQGKMEQRFVALEGMEEKPSHLLIETIARTESDRVIQTGPKLSLVWTG